MRLRLALVLATTAAVAAADLAVKASVPGPAWTLHARSQAFLAFSLLLVAGIVGLALLPSRLVAAAGGPIAGGMLANVVSAATHSGRVPNPFVVGSVGFNLADVFVVLGVALLTLALARLAIRHRAWIDRRIPPRPWERGLRRRLGL